MTTKEQDEKTLAVIRGLTSIVESPLPELVSFNPNAVKTAKDALELISHLRRMEQKLHALTAYALTAEPRNTKEWMQGLVSRCNSALEILGEADQFRAAGPYGHIKRV